SSDLLVEQSGRLVGKDNGKEQSGNASARAKIEIPFEEGNAAYGKGDYQRAAKILTPWAQQGNVSAQIMLGTLFMDGKGVEQDFDQARKWFSLAAQQGNVNAQYNMGIMCYNGDGGEQDDVEAYMWFAVAAKNGSKSAARQLKPLSRKMPVDAFKEAQRKAAEWKPGVPAETEADAAE
ncbi:MAG: sel1 repeat family protein, partial [Alphaproteobacteria bacterium]|nr:sel1 repeat family protein [Alphaproteobacteria bacterium]